jgi:predicted nucleic acid-binding protein
VIVVDASVLVPALADDGPEGQRSRGRLTGERLAAPELLDLEVTSVIRRALLTGDITERRAEQALEDLLALPLRRAPHRPLVRRVWELRENVTSYDAAYVALAEALEAPLLTADARLARATGVRCPVESLR